MIDDPQKRWDQMKTLGDRAEAAKQRARGVLEELKRELLADWKCKSLADARKLVAKMEKESENLSSTAEAAFEQFQIEWEAWNAKLKEHQDGYCDE